MTAHRRGHVAWGLAALAACAMGGVLPARAAFADRPTEAMRARVEEAFVDGRLAMLEELVPPGDEPISVEPLAVRDLYWRPVTGPRTWRAPKPTEDPGSVSARRIAWLHAHAAARTRGEPYTTEPYPMPIPGEDDPYPHLTAWVLDRQLRESAGSDSIDTIDTDGPLGDVEADGTARDRSAELIGYWVRGFRRPAMAGPGSDAETDEATRARRQAVRDRVAAARTLAYGAVGFWALVGGLLLFVRRRRLPPPPPDDRPG